MKRYTNFLRQFFNNYMPFLFFIDTITVSFLCKFIFYTFSVLPSIGLN